MPTRKTKMKSAHLGLISLPLLFFGKVAMKMKSKPLQSMHSEIASAPIQMKVLRL
ncbi:hypothetical protein D3C87_1238820 [compost metagenome]